MPTIEWNLNGRPIATSKNVRIESTPDSTTLTISKCGTSDSGVYKVVAENDVGSDSAEIQVSVLGKPAAPQSLRVTEVNKDYVVLQWEPPEADGGSEITGYVIEKKDVSKLNWFSAGTVDGRTTKFRCTKLLEGTEYLFRVSAENKIGMGEGAEISEAITAKLPYGPPSPPRKLTVTELTKTGCCLLWKEPEFDGGAPVTGYYVERQTGYTPRWMRVNKAPVDQTRLVIRDLVELNEYLFQVVAENDAGESKPSEPTGKVVPKDPYSKPSAPGKPNVEDITEDAAHITWTAPEDDGNSPITKYIIEMRAAGDFNWTVCNPIDTVTKTSFTARGLRPGADYEFRVSAENRLGQSPYSECSSPVKFGECPYMNPVVVTFGSPW